MPQEFQVLRCYCCGTFQVHQVKKSCKWNCKLCGEKQSIQKVYGRGSGIDCRKHVQKLNTLRGELEQQEGCQENSGEEQHHHYETLTEHTEGEGSGVPRGSRWDQYTEVEEEDPPDIQQSQTYTTDRQAFDQVRKDNRKWARANFREKRKGWQSSQIYGKQQAQHGGDAVKPQFGARAGQYESLPWLQCASSVKPTNAEEQNQQLNKVPPQDVEDFPESYSHVHSFENLTPTGAKVGQLIQHHVAQEHSVSKPRLGNVNRNVNRDVNTGTVQERCKIKKQVTDPNSKWSKFVDTTEKSDSEDEEDDEVLQYAVLLRRKENMEGEHFDGCESETNRKCQADVQLWTQSRQEFKNVGHLSQNIINRAAPDNECYNEKTIHCTTQNIFPRKKNKAEANVMSNTDQVCLKMSHDNQSKSIVPYSGKVGDKHLLFQVGEDSELDDLLEL